VHDGDVGLDAGDAGDEDVVVNHVTPLTLFATGPDKRVLRVPGRVMFERIQPPQ
jgi:hypothetical protein